MLLRAKLLQSCLTLCDPMDYRVPIDTRSLCPWDFPGKNTGAGLPCPSPGDLPDPGIKLTSFISPALVGGFFTPSSVII